MESMNFVRNLRKSYRSSFLAKNNLLLFIFLAIFLVACNLVQNTQGKSQVIPYSISELNTSLDTAYADNIYNILLGELYSQSGDIKLSAKHYQNLVTETDNAALAKRATILAATSGLNNEALKAARSWINLSPESLEARQYLSLLLLRNKNFDNAVEQIQKIRLYIEKEETEKHEKDVYSKGLKFIGSMLNIESYHENALLVFQRYIEKYGREKEKTQQYLILSSLAMNAKKYDVVLSAFKSIEDEDLKHTSKITLMKVKALRESNKISEATQILQQFVDKQQPSDSTKLQLVRLLILNDQKKSASPYLKELVNKYPNNNDLLKSLIALEIDQSQLQSAKNNIKKLSKSKDYDSDVAYFSGEISEAEGDIQSALKSYQKVTKGSLQKRAKKKIIKLRMLN